MRSLVWFGSSVGLGSMRGVATWWTRQYSHYRERYAEALCDLALRHGFGRPIAT